MLKPKTARELQAESRQRWDAVQAMEADHAEQRRLKRAEQEEQERQIREAKAARQAYIDRGEEPPKVQAPGWDTLFTPREQIIAAAEEAERQRIAALSTAQIWLSTLSHQEQEKVHKWTLMNPGMTYPIPRSAVAAIEASRPKPEPEPNKPAQITSYRGRQAVLQSILKAAKTP